MKKQITRSIQQHYKVGVEKKISTKKIEYHVEAVQTINVFFKFSCYFCVCLTFIYVYTCQKSLIFLFSNLKLIDKFMSFQIDYKNEVLYGVLQRMAPSIGNSQPILREYWICNIDPKISPQIIKLIKSKFQETTDDLKHLKRMRKENINGKNILKVIICPVEGEYSNDDIINLIKETTQLENITLEKKEIPMNKPFDKEINNEWSQKFWPLLWKGNPLVQDLNEIYKKIDIQKVHKYMNQVFELSGDTVSNGIFHFCIIIQ